MNQANAYGVWHIARLEFFTLKVAGLEVEGCNLLPELRERGYRKKAELHGAPRYETRSMPKGMK